VIHGRDQLDSLWPEHYTAEENAEQPAEEFHRLEQGSDCGWPYTYVDARTGVRMVAPEYGGDGLTVDGSARYQDPIAIFPAHWAPNDLLFYDGGAFPARYAGGAFVAFHGSWNRAPFRQRGYQVAFVPFEGDAPSGPWETFADGFAGSDDVASPRDADFRPMGLAQDASGALLIADSVRGRIWRVTYAGPEEKNR
jgi:glucose/arabinose dehydrogenase